MAVDETAINASRTTNNIEKDNSADPTKFTSYRTRQGKTIHDAALSGIAGGIAGKFMDVLTILYAQQANNTKATRMRGKDFCCASRQSQDSLPSRTSRLCSLCRYLYRCLPCLCPYIPWNWCTRATTGSLGYTGTDISICWHQVYGVWVFPSASNAYEGTGKRSSLVYGWSWIRYISFHVQ